MINGIDISQPYLPRIKLINRIITYKTQFLITASAYGSGKTSLFTLLRNQYKCTRFVYVRFNPNANPYALSKLLEQI